MDPSPYSSGSNAELEEHRNTGSELFRTYASHRLEQVRSDMNIVLGDQLQRLCLDLVSLHQDLSHEGPKESPRGNLECRRVDSKRISLGDWDGDEGLPATEVGAPDLFPSIGSSMRSRGESEVSFGASEVHSEAFEQKIVDQEQPESYSAFTSGMVSPLAHEFSVFDLHELWKQDEDGAKRMQSKPEVGRKKRSNGFLRRNSLEFRSGAEVTGRGYWSCLVMRPSSPQCLVWDVCCFVAIIHDTIMIPLLSAFPIDGRGEVLRSMELISSCIWFADVPLTLLRGFLDTRKGIVELRLRYIAIHYAKGWMLADVTLCVIDVVSYAMGDVELASLTLLRLTRNLRIFRIMKMMSRLAVLKEMMMSIDSRLESSSSGASGSIFVETSLVVVKQLGVIALLCHFTGCAFYGLGQMQAQDGNISYNWVAAHSDFRAATFGEDCPWEYMYVTAVHWSLTQFTPAAMDVVAVTELERVFSVVVTLAGLIVFSFFIGTINQALAKLRYATAQELQQNQLVRRYVNENGISVGLATEILTFIKQRGLGKAQSKLVSGDIKVLKVLPRHLRDSLLEEVSLPVLFLHPLFKYLSTTSYDEMARLCHKAIKEGKVVHGEEIFQTNSPPDRMFFLTTGRLRYSMDAVTGDTEDVKEAMHISEATLWLKWEYRGRLNCEDQSAHFLTLDAPLFRKVVCRSSLNEVAMVYARMFLQLMVETYENEDEASDLFGNEPGQLDHIVKTVKGVQDGAAKFSTLGLQRGPDVEEAFDAWKEMWLQAKKKKKGSTWRFWDWIQSLYGEKPKVSSRASETSQVSSRASDSSKVKIPAAPEVKIINTEALPNQS